MKNCGRLNFRKHRDITDGEKYITLDIYLNFVSLYDMRITSSQTKDYLGGPGKGLITSMGLKTVRRRKKKKKERYAINNFIIKDISKIIKEFEDLPYEGYVQKRSKHVPTDSYFYPA